MREFGRRLRDAMIQKSHPVNVGYNTFIGCSDVEIQELMARQNVAWLPQLYISFLKEMGHFAGGYWMSEYMSYKHLLRLKDTVIDLATFNRLSLPEDSFVFMSSQDVGFWFFTTDDKNEDPVVYSYIDVDDDFVETEWTLAEFLSDPVSDVINEIK